MEWEYCEDYFAAMPQREQYEASLERLVAARRLQQDARRTAFAKTIWAAPEEARARFVQMLGWPLTEYRPAQPLQVRAAQLHASPQMVIRRLELELWKDFWFSGLLFLHPDETQRPLVLCQHGGQGTPELCSGLLPLGSVNYNHMTQRVFERGANVFAPQLFLWDLQLYGCRPEQQGKTRDEIRRGMDASLKNLGGSIMAVELTCLRRCLDYLEGQPWVKPGALGMCGLSYGGQYALFLSAVEPRLQATVSSCYFNDRHTVEWPDYTWFDAAGHFFDTEIAMLTHPRKLFLQAAARDEVFFADGARREWQRLQTLCGDECSWVDFRLFDGAHELDPDDGQIQALTDLLWQL